MSVAYYNEFDPKKAAWLRELISAGHIAPGEVDERSIRDVRPEDLEGFTQCHFFAGIGVWSHCLRRAGWPDHRPVWTGSPPCQPFSVAGKRKAENDDRHLWPELFRLIRKRLPESVFCEQVASKDGQAWLDAVLTDLEGCGFAVWPVAVPACGFGAPHRRERLAIAAKASGPGVVLDDTCGTRREGNGLQSLRSGGDRERPDTCSAGPSAVGERMGYASIGGRREFGNATQPRRGGHTNSTEQDGRLALSHIDRRYQGRASQPEARNDGAFGNGGLGVTLGDAIGAGLEGHGGHGHNWSGWQEQARPIAPAGVTGGFWSGAELIWCRDEKWRPAQPGIFPLAYGAAKGMVRVRDPGAPIDADATAEARTLRLKGYGDAIVTDAYVAVIECAMELKEFA